jgi:sarcosine oxidase subunit beta
MGWTTDIAVVGGGAYGLSIAHALRQRRPDLSVTLLDRGDFASGETGRCGAGIRVQWGATGNILLSLHSLEMFERFAELYDYPDGIEFKQTGYLMLAYTESQLELFKVNQTIQAKYGIHPDILTPQEVTRLAPSLNVEGMLGAVFFDRDASLSPFRVLDGYAHAARRLGADLRWGVDVQDLARAGDGFQLATSAGLLNAGRVILATDTRIPQLLAPLGLDLPVKPLPNQAFVTEPLAPLLEPCVMSFGHEMFLNQTARGSFVVVCSDKGRSFGFDAAPRADLFPRSAGRAISLVPALAGARVLRSWGGLYSVTPDMQPVLGETAVPGLIVALSSAKGFMTSPAAGRIIAELVDGVTPPDWVAALGPGRFDGRPLEKEPAVV